MRSRFDPFPDLNWAFGPRWTTVPDPTHDHAVPIDAVRSDDGVTVYFDLPGVAPDAVDLEVENHELRLSAERQPVIHENETWITNQRPTGSFRRTLHLSEALDADRVEARWDNGVLAVRIPLAETAKARKVAISAPSEASELES